MVSLPPQGPVMIGFPNASGGDEHGGGSYSEEQSLGGH